MGGGMRTTDGSDSQESSLWKRGRGGYVRLVHHRDMQAVTSRAHQLAIKGCVPINTDPKHLPGSPLVPAVVTVAEEQDTSQFGLVVIRCVI
jgi:hypothetical protein